MVEAAKRAAVPVCVHLDHGETLEYLQQAAMLVKETGIDALACSFGTTYGIYPTEPQLDFDVVKNVRALAGQIPIVMHGGSGGNAAAEYINSVKEGEPVFFSAASMAARDAMKEKFGQGYRDYPSRRSVGKHEMDVSAVMDDLLKSGDI